MIKPRAGDSVDDFQEKILASVEPLIGNESNSIVRRCEKLGNIHFKVFY